jgi:hypothetical protein
LSHRSGEPSAIERARHSPLGRRGDRIKRAVTDETFAGTPKNDNIRETKRGREE